MRFLLLFFLFMSHCCSMIYAQNTTVKGRIASSDDKSYLIGANVVELNTSNGTVTDLDGNFTLTLISQSMTLIVSYVGYTSQEVAIVDTGMLNIVLSPLSTIMNEVVVTGYKKEIRTEVSSAVTSLKSKDINKLVVSGIDQALQGQAAGVSVTQVTGSPGDDIAVRIRGVGTLGNNNPLYVIDGIPTTGGLNMFSLGDIASIDILKDAAAAAVYGARAANGVVLITTKRGSTGKPVFTFESYYGVQEANRLPKLLNSKEYLMIRNEAITNANTLRNVANQIPTYDTAILDTLPDNDWLDIMFNPANIQRYALSARGGSENSNYYMSGEYYTQGGIFKGQNFDKYQVRINAETHKGRFRIGNNLVFAHTNRKVINGSGDGFGPGNELSGIRYTLITAPVFITTHKDGSPVKVSSELGDPTLFGDGNANPLVFVNSTDWTIKKYRVFGNVFAEVNVAKGLNVRSTLGGDFNFDNEKLFKERLSAAIYSPSSLNEGRVFNNTLVWNNTIDFAKQFGAHKLSTLVGMEAIQNHTDYLGASANNFRKTDPLFRYLSASTPVDLKNLGVSGIATEWSLLSYFGQMNYVFANKYVLSGTLRKDGSSRFGKNNRWAIFPSVSAAWNVTNEGFFPKNTPVSSLKVRASWGQLGNQEIGIYPYSSLVSTGEYVYSFGDEIVTGATIKETGNSNIKWETSTQKNIGIDMSMWNDRITLNADYFKKKTDDILVRVPIPQAGGGSRPPFVNAASVENTGIEVSLSVRQRIKNINFTLGGNISAIQNNVVSIADSEPISGGFGLSDGPITKTEPGYPVGSFFLWQMDGIFQTQEEIDASPFQTTFTRPGDVKFKDLNADNKIDDKDRTHTGSPFPNFTYGLTLGVTKGKFDFTALLQGVQGNDVYFLYGNFAYETQLRGFNSYSDILNRWTPEKPSTTFPKVSVDDRNGNRRASTRFLQDGSYARLRNVTIGYNFVDVLGLKNVSSFRAYFSVQNALTFTKYAGLDPEIQANANDTRGLGTSSDLSVGIDWGTVPSARTWTFGITTEF
jgi:TonB-dependent starch-binding outer membrane protein SusC